MPLLDKLREQYGVGPLCSELHIAPSTIRRQLVLPTRANYTGRTLQCDIKSRLLLPSLSFSCSFHLSVRTYIRDGSAGLPPPPP